MSRSDPTSPTDVMLSASMEQLFIDTSLHRHHRPITENNGGSGGIRKETSSVLNILQNSRHAATLHQNIYNAYINANRHYNSKQYALNQHVLPPSYLPGLSPPLIENGDDLSPSSSIDQLPNSSSSVGIVKNVINVDDPTPTPKCSICYTLESEETPLRISFILLERGVPILTLCPRCDAFLHHTNPMAIKRGGIAISNISSPKSQQTSSTTVSKYSRIYGFDTTKSKLEEQSWECVICGVTKSIQRRTITFPTYDPPTHTNVCNNDGLRISRMRTRTKKRMEQMAAAAAHK